MKKASFCFISRLWPHQSSGIFFVVFIVWSGIVGFLKNSTHCGVTANDWSISQPIAERRIWRSPASYKLLLLDEMDGQRYERKAADCIENPCISLLSPISRVIVRVIQPAVRQLNSKRFLVATSFPCAPLCPCITVRSLLPTSYRTRAACGFFWTVSQLGILAQMAGNNTLVSVWTVLF